MQTQAPSQPNPTVQPQGQLPQQAQPMAPQSGQPSQQPSGRAGQNYDPRILQHIETHMNSVPPEQKAFVAQYMTPELAVILGIIIGNEAYDYFKKFADPKKELTVQPRQNQPEQNTAPQPAPQASSPQQSGPQQGPVAPSAQTQPKATAPSIMGV